MFYNNNANILVRGILVRQRLKWESKYVHLSTLLVFTNKDVLKPTTNWIHWCQNKCKTTHKRHNKRTTVWLSGVWNKKNYCVSHILLVVIWSNFTSFGPTKSNTMYIYTKSVFQYVKDESSSKMIVIFLEHVCIVIKNIEPF